MNVSVHGAKTQLSKLLDLVEDGESIVIERHARPVAQLVPVRTSRGSRLGAMRGQFTMAEGWERALTDEEAEAFWGGRGGRPRSSPTLGFCTSAPATSQPSPHCRPCTRTPSIGS